MKALKLSLVVMGAALVTIGLSGMAYAFHSGGVADCDGCHTMHNSLGGKAVALKGGSTQFTGYNYLLQGSDQSSTCLNCHGKTNAGAIASGNYAFTTVGLTVTPGTPPIQRTPGGDFGWLYKNYPAVGHAPASPGNQHGHNITAQDYNLPNGNPPTTAAPGGTYLTANLYCTSCHNPHSSARIVSNPVTTTSIVNSALGTAVPPISGSGSYTTSWPPAAGTAVGVYRLLGGVGYVPYSYQAAPPFINPPPLAIAPAGTSGTYNQTEATHEVRVAYGTVGGAYGMAEWCQNCHPQIYNNNSPVTTGHLIHPNGVNAVLSVTANISGTLTTIEAIYNAYINSGNLTNTVATSYTSLVPYEEATNDMTVLSAHANSNGSYLQGTTLGTEHVTCLSCHRAHASGFNQGTRWNNNAEFLTVAGLWPDSGTTASSGYSNGMPQGDYQAAMYDRPATIYATYQRSLCNKCHGKD